MYLRHSHAVDPSAFKKSALQAIRWLLGGWNRPRCTMPDEIIQSLKLVDRQNFNVHWSAWQFTHKGVRFEYRPRQWWNGVNAAEPEGYTNPEALFAVRSCPHHHVESDLLIVQSPRQFTKPGTKYMIGGADNLPEADGLLRWVRSAECNSCYEYAYWSGSPYGGTGERRYRRADCPQTSQGY